MPELATSRSLFAFAHAMIAAVWALQVATLHAIVLAAVDQIERQQFVAKNCAAMIDVVQKEIERSDALRQPIFDLAPLGGADDAW